VASVLRTAALAVTLALTMALSAVDSPTAAAAPAGRVTMTNDLVFAPNKITIKVGQTVEWHNVSVLVHTVTADPKLAANRKDVALPAGAKVFNSGSIEPKGTFRHTFTVAGTYRYFCIPHEAAGMTGEVIVKP